MEDPTLALATIVALGVGAQWAAARFQVPAILLLLGVGVAAGPGLDLVDPDELLGPLLFPVVSLGVGLLLFEGGLGLHFSELGAWRGVLFRLLTVGVVVSGATATVAGLTVGGLPVEGAVIFGAMMTVTGPTVIVPLLRQVRLRPRVARVLRWEGIFVDAIGATLAIVAAEAVLAEGGAVHAVRLAGSTAAAGVAAGVLGAFALSVVLGRGLVPDHAEIAVIVMAVVTAFAASNHLREESGLLAATVMGVVMANQRRAPIRHVVAFHESLGTLLIGGIFVLLGARVDPEALRSSLLPGLAIVAVLVIVGRPLTVAASTFRTPLPRNERIFLAGMAPRGIVAAAVSELLALRLEEAGNEAGADLAALTFVVVSGTVLVYGMCARRLADRLRVAMPQPTGVAFVGAPPWAIDIANRLVAADIAVMMIAADDREARMARHADLLVYDGALGNRNALDALDATGIRQVITVSDRDELNGFATERLSDVVGRANVYELPLDPSPAGDPPTRPFGAGLDRSTIADLVAHGARIETVRAADRAPEGFHALLTIADGQVQVAPSPDNVVGDVVIGLVPDRH